MAITVDLRDAADRGWDERLSRSRFGNIYQTTRYAEYASKRLGWQPVYVRFLHGNDTVSQLLMFKYSRHEKKIGVSTISKLMPGKMKAMLQNYRWAYGPVILNDEYHNDAYRALGNFLSGLEGRINGTTHPLDSNNEELEIQGCKKEKWGTFLVDLTLDKQELWQLLDKKAARKNIERARERGVTVRAMQDGDLQAYYDLLKETREMLEVGAYNYDDIYDLWHILKDAGFAGFMAYQDGRPLSGLLISTFNKYINEWGVARSLYDAENHLYSQDVIKWAIIEWGHDNDCSYYDLTGVNPNPTDEKEKGIFRYKQKWGGRLAHYTMHKRL